MYYGTDQLERLNNFYSKYTNMQICSFFNTSSCGFCSDIVDRRATVFKSNDQVAQTVRTCKKAIIENQSLHATDYLIKYREHTTRDFISTK